MKACIRAILIIAFLPSHGKGTRRIQGILMEMRRICAIPKGRGLRPARPFETLTLRAIAAQPTPWAIIASATFRNPAMLAPET